MPVVSARHYQALPSLVTMAYFFLLADTSGRTVWGVGLRPLAFWDFGFEFRRREGCMCLPSVLCYQVDVSASGWSLLHRSPTECGVSECDHEASIKEGPWPTRGCCATKHKVFLLSFPFINNRFPCRISSSISHQCDAVLWSACEESKCNYRVLKASVV
jgi:hypothetical protein